MLTSNLKKNLIVYFFIFFKLLSKQRIVNLYSLNVFFFFKIKYFFNLNKYFKNNFLNQSDFFFKKKSLFNSYIVDYNFNVLNDVSFEKKFYLKRNTNLDSFNYFLSTFNVKFYYKLLSFFFLNTFLSYNSFFARTGFFSLFFFKNSRGTPYLINLNKIMSR